MAVTRMLRAKIVTWAIIICAGLFSACNADWDREISGIPPIKKTRFLGKKEVYITAVPGTPMKTLVELEIFGDFWPKITFDEALSNFGKPDDIRLERRVDKFYVYHAEHGQIEVVRRRLGSEGDERITWTLRIRPSTTNPRSILRPEVLSYLPGNGGSLNVTIIAGESGEARVRVDLEEGEVARVIWLS